MYSYNSSRLCVSCQPMSQSTARFAMADQSRSPSPWASAARNRLPPSFADRVFKFRDIMEREEPLDEIDPRAGCWDEVELETLLSGEPALHLLCLVRSVIVDDERQIEADGSFAVDLPEELQIFVCPVARQALRTDATSVQSSAQYSLAGTLDADAF
jgi:hypothetical protein